MSEKFSQVSQLKPTFFFTDIAQTRRPARNQESFIIDFLCSNLNINSVKLPKIKGQMFSPRIQSISINLEFDSRPLSHSRKVLVCDGIACTTESTSAHIMEIPYDFYGENEDDGDGDDDDDDDDDSLTLLSFWEHIWRFPTIFLTRSWQNALRGGEESVGSREH